MDKRVSVKHDSYPGLDPVIGTDPESGTAVSYVPLKSIQPYRTQDEFLVAMREDLTEWLNTLYDLRMEETSLFDHLSTGVLLCQHANAFSDAMRCSKDSNRPSNVSSVSTSASEAASDPTVSGSGHQVQYNRGAQPGTFHSRVNISNFLSWCRTTLGLRDTLLFETEDLVQGRNERNVVLCLLEVARRGARIGMLAPSLVQLEAEIDEEMRRDADAALRGKDDVTDGRHGYSGHLHGNSGGEGGSGAEGTRDVGVQTVDDVERIGAGMVQTFLRYSSESICSSESSFKHHRTPVKAHPHPHPHPPRAAPSHPSQAAAPSTPGRPSRTRPVIEVDLMSLDEMVRKLLNQCTCEFQYPMIRVSEGKYRIGESLTFIFVRILRNHVMVRIGGGWDTLENYLNRHDPCRMEAKAPKAGAHSTRGCTHTSNAQSTSSVVSSSTVGQQNDEHARQEATDNAPEITSNASFQQDASERSSDDLTLHHQFHGSVGRTEDRKEIRSTETDPGETVSPFGTGDDVTGIADTCTRVTPSGKVVVDVACQTEVQMFARRYSSSSGASSLEPTNERLEVSIYKSQEQTDETLPVDHTDSCVSNVNVDETSNSNEANRNRTNDSFAVTSNQTASNAQKQQKKRNVCPADSVRTKPSRTLPTICRQCANPMSVSDKRIGDLCSMCSKRNAAECRSSTKDQRHGGNDRPGSAQDKRILPDRPGSAQDKRHRTLRPGSAQERGQRPERPGSAQSFISRVGKVSSGTDHALADKIAITGSEKGVTPALSQIKRQSKQRPASAQDNRPSNSRPSTRHTNRVPGSEQASLGPSSRQRPSSAREHQRGAAVRTALNNDPAGDRPRRMLPRIDSAENRFDSERDSRPTSKTKNEEDLVGKGFDFEKRTPAGTTVFRRRSLNTTRTVKLSMVSELDSLDPNSSSSSRSESQHNYIPETIGFNMDEVQAMDNDEKDSTAKMRPRKDVQRRGSLNTKIPKPV